MSLIKEMNFVKSTPHCIQCSVLIIPIIIFFFLFFDLHTNLKPGFQFSLHRSTAPKEKELLILLWTWPFGERFPFSRGHIEGSSCMLTDDRRLLSLADAVIIHHRDVSLSKELLPKFPRPNKQYWIWFNMESPSHVTNLAMMDNLFNLTMTYRADSDIVTPYGWLEKHNCPQNISIPAKERLVAWVISNWNPLDDRCKYYKALKNYVDIDVYGKYHKPLPKYYQSSVLSKYKFYLAFENSVDRDYITEKLWTNAFLSRTVPIVLGPPRKNYERFIPGDSFIHVDDFSNSRELSAYILELDKDDQRYNAYFQWTSWLRPVTVLNWTEYFCKACNTLEQTQSYRTIPSLTVWFKN
uniref:Fucosyltransferase n=1 Tax=Leptobrachium leishanense TaxID=445787 RepID=A0A8C5PH37_9ANUR